MKVISLQSGSNGNCTYVEAHGTQLLIDAGISGSRAQQRLAAHGLDISSVDALLISHDHIDHTRCMGVFHRKFGLPIHATEATFAEVEACRDSGRIDDVRHFVAGNEIRIGRLIVGSIPTPHDAADGVAFVVDDGKRRVGILTDLGHVFDGLDEIVRSLHAVVIESNYDPEMLATGPYPESLQKRIRGGGGHLSNVDAGQLIADAGSRRLKWACLAHLSEQNNDPEIAVGTHQEIYGNKLPLYVASRCEAVEIGEV